MIKNILLVCFFFFSCKEKEATPQWTKAETAQAYGRVFQSFLEEGRFAESYLMISDEGIHDLKNAYPDYLKFHYQWYATSGKVLYRLGQMHSTEIEDADTILDIWGGEFRLFQEKRNDFGERISVGYSDGEYRVMEYQRYFLDPLPVNYNSPLRTEFALDITEYKRKLEENFKEIFDKGDGKFHIYRNLMIQKIKPNPKSSESKMAMNFVNDLSIGKNNLADLYWHPLEKVGVDKKIDYKSFRGKKFKYLGEITFKGTPYYDFFHKKIFFRIEYEKDGEIYQSTLICNVLENLFINVHIGLFNYEEQNLYEIIGRARLDAAINKQKKLWGK